MRVHINETGGEDAALQVDLRRSGERHRANCDDAVSADCDITPNCGRAAPINDRGIAQDHVRPVRRRLCDRDECDSTQDKGRDGALQARLSGAGDAHDGTVVSDGRSEGDFFSHPKAQCERN